MNHWVEIAFDCLPLRSVTRFDIPLDASPKFRARCERIKSAIAEHGTFNTYFLYNASCCFHLTNDPEFGRLEFSFDGTLITDNDDLRSSRAILDVRLERETCDWLTQPDVEFFKKSVTPAVLVEFNRFIVAGDLEQTKRRIAHMQSQADESGGFLGMYL